MASTPQLRIAYALHMARKNRCEPSCRCGRYQGRWCSERDQHWSERMDAELEAMCE